MYGVELYRRLAGRDRRRPVVARGRARCAWPRRRRGSRSSSARPAGRGRSASPLELISADEARDRFPLMTTDGVLGAAVAADRRLARPVEPRLRARRRRPRARRDDPQPPPRRRDRRPRRAGDGRRGRARRRAVDDRGRGRGQRGRDVRARDRPPGRHHPADHPDGAPVPADGADRGRRARPAPAPRPGQPRVLPRGGRRAVHGRLRARPDAVGARRDPGGLQPPAARSRLAPVRARSWPAPSAGSPRSPTPP